jgi:hypothetical protein
MQWEENHSMEGQRSCYSHQVEEEGWTIEDVVLANRQEKVGYWWL